MNNWGHELLFPVVYRTVIRNILLLGISVRVQPYFRRNSSNLMKFIRFVELNPTKMWKFIKFVEFTQTGSGCFGEQKSNGNCYFTFSSVHWYPWLIIFTSCIHTSCLEPTSCLIEFYKFDELNSTNMMNFIKFVEFLRKWGRSRTVSRVLLLQHV